MKKIYQSPSMMVHRIIAKHHLLLGSETQNVGVVQSETPVVASEEALSKESLDILWEE